MIEFVEAKDFCCLGNVKLPLAKQGLTYITADNRDTDAADNNGSGKTTLFKALTWGLFGETIDGDKGDEVIRRGTKKAIVAVGFEDGWKVERSRTKGKPKVALFDDKGEQWKASKEDVEAEVARRLGGLDFQSFKNTVLYGQGDSKRFADKATKDADRKEILHRILKTELLKRCHEWAKAEARRLKAERDAWVVKIDTLEAKRGEHDVDGLEARFNQWETERDEEVEELVEEAKDLRDKAKALEEEKAKIPELEAGIAELEGKLAECEKAAKAADEAEERLDAARKVGGDAYEKTHKIRRDISTAKVKLEGAEDQLSELDGDRCPVCTSPLNEGHALEHRNELAERVKKHKQALKRLEADMTKARKEHAESEKAVAAALEAFQEARDIADKASGYSRKITILKGEIAEAEKAELRSAGFVKQAKEALKRIKARNAETNPFEELLEEAKAKAKDFTKQKKKAAKGLDAVRYDLAHYEFWTKGFGNQGLPSFVLDSIMPYLTERTNAYLRILADGDITVAFSTQRELKSSKGEVRDEIEISWTIEGVEGSTPSGGQGKKIEISVGLALMDLVAAREGSNVDLIALDEVLDGLDREGRARVLQLLQDLRARRNSIFVVSHETDVSEVFEKTLVVVKENGIARLET